ncbi:MAG: hypothetical protein R2911_08565 [Caldilineaceae bacterium]
MKGTVENHYNDVYSSVIVCTKWGAMATIEIDQRWVDELHLLGHDAELDLSAEIEVALRQHLFKLRQAKINARQWYEAHHGELVKKYIGRYIAIHNQTVVDTDADGRALAKRSALSGGAFRWQLFWSKNTQLRQRLPSAIHALALVHETIP